MDPQTINAMYSFNENQMSKYNIIITKNVSKNKYSLLYGDSHVNIHPHANLYFSLP